MRTAMVIDADPGSAKLLAVLLENEGWLVQIASTPAEALASLATMPTDLILLEVNPLPRGLPLLEALRRDESTRSIPVVLVSSFNGDDVNALVLDAGCLGYFHKPVDVSTFIATLNRMLGDES